MKQFLLGIVAAVLLALAGCVQPVGGGSGDSTSINRQIQDPALWFEDIYNDLLERGITVGQAANCEYVYQRIKQVHPTSSLPPPVPGTEHQPANCEYLLKYIDKENEWITGHATKFGTSKFATQQMVDTIAVDRAIDLLYGTGGKFVIFGDSSGVTGNSLWHSTEGTNWTWISNTIGTTDHGKIAYGDGIWVMLGEAYANRYSTDGINWTRNNSLSYRYSCLCYANGEFTAIGKNGSTLVISKSTDGITWNHSNAVGFTIDKNRIVYGNGVYIAILADDYRMSRLVAYSTDGINWTEVLAPFDASYPDYYYDITWGNGAFVICGVNQGPSRDHSITIMSTDGINWTRKLHSEYDGLVRITYGNGKFIATIGLSSYPAAYFIAKSVDGINWAYSTNNPQGTPSSIGYGNGKFVVLYGKNVYYSEDGDNWIAGNGTFPNDFNDIHITFGGY